MHGLGNDFVLIDGVESSLDESGLSKLAAQVCDRHFGIGADGLILVLKSEKADFRMRIFNPDGSEPEMCGNGIRCFAKYVYDLSKGKKDVFSVETPAGIMVPAIIIKNGVAVGVEVDMGVPNPDRKTVDYELDVDGQKFKITAVSMGNPHCVIFVDDPNAVDLAYVGPKIENHSKFPNRTNVEFVKVVNENEITVRVWERGAGETLACGTGACAAVVASAMAGRTARRALVHLPGGDLEVDWEKEDGHVALRGPAERVFEGEYYLR
jgi:diaminopimelate epimerase